MKKMLLAGAALLFAGALIAATVMTDDFDYGATPGNLTAVTANWTAHSGAGVGPVGYQTTGLSMAGYAYAGTGGAATISTTGSEDVNRTYAVQADVYVSALVNISAGGTGTYFLHLKDPGTNYRARVYARDSGGNLQFGLSNLGTGIYSTTNFAYNTTYLVVVRYDGNTNTATLHVLTNVPATEPVTPLMTATDSTALLTMQGVALRQAAGGPAAVIDGIRVGNTWAETVPVELQSLSAE